MNVGIVVDATCDLPASILERNGISILPMTIPRSDEHFLDIRNPEQTNDYYQKNSPAQIASFTPSLPSQAEIIEFLKDKSIYHYDNLLIFAPSMNTSDMLIRLRQSILTLQPDIEILRRQASLSKPLRIRTVETQNTYSGYGLIVYEAMQLIHERVLNVDQIKQPLEHFIQNATTLVLPGKHFSTYTLLEKQPFSLGWMTIQRLKISRKIPCFRIQNSEMKIVSEFKETNAENEFIKMVYEELAQRSLSNHLVNVSFAGRLPQLRILPSLKHLQAHVQANGGKIVYSSMSPASATQLGGGAISVAFA